jgi:hypothetical protein
LQPASPYRHILCLSDEAAVGILLPIPKLIWFYAVSDILSELHRKTDRFESDRPYQRVVTDISRTKREEISGSTIVCLKLWETFSMKLTVAFSSSKGNSYLVRHLRTPNTVTSRTWKIWVVCCVWCVMRKL